MRHLVYRSPPNPSGDHFRGNLEGYSYVCPTCGELWGKLIIGAPGRGFMVITARCEEHGTRYSLGGTLISPLLYWGDEPAGNPRVSQLFLEKALTRGSIEFLRHEALIRAEALTKENL